MKAIEYWEVPEGATPFFVEFGDWGEVTVRPVPCVEGLPGIISKKIRAEVYRAIQAVELVHPKGATVVWDYGNLALYKKVDGQRTQLPVEEINGFWPEGAEHLVMAIVGIRHHCQDKSKKEEKLMYDFVSFLLSAAAVPC